MPATTASRSWGSEGYLINEFTAPRSNDRTDGWGGSLENRLRLAVETTKAVRAKVGRDFLIVFRVSSIDLVQGGLTAEEIVAEARAVEAAGADIINQGIGWHEARVPTIAQKVPRAAWAFAARRLKDAVRIPVIASNRINTPDVAEAILAAGDADLVSMARPMLADPEFANKAREGRADEINVCIACNQACLDFIFSNRVASCLVNPKAGRELEFDVAPPVARKRIAVVGAGPAGLACAVTAAERGHAVTLYEAAAQDRWPAQPRAQRAGQGGVRRDLALLPGAHGQARRRDQAERAAGCGRAGGGWLRRDRHRHRCGAARAGYSRHRSCELRELRRDPRGELGGRAPCGGDRCGRHRLRRRGVPDLAAAGRGCDERAFPGRVGRRCRHRRPRWLVPPPLGEGQGGGNRPRSPPLPLPQGGGPQPPGRHAPAQGGTHGPRARA